MTATHRARFEAGLHVAGVNPKAWLPEEEAIVREMAGEYDGPAIVAEIQRRVGTERTPSGLYAWVHRAGIELGCNLMCPSDVARMLGLPIVALRRYQHSGLIEAERWTHKNGGGDHTRYIIRPAAIEAFIKQYPYLVTPSMISDPRYRSLAEVYSRACRHISVKEAAGVLGMNPDVLCEMVYHHRTGNLNCYRLPGCGRMWFMDKGDLPVAKQLAA